MIVIFLNISKLILFNDRNLQRDDYQDGTESFRLYYSQTLSDTDNYYGNVGNWNHKDYKLDKIESVEDEKTIFFSLDGSFDVRLLFGSILST